MKKSNLERKEMKEKITSAMLALIMAGMLSMAFVIPNAFAANVHDIAVISVEPNVDHQYPGRTVDINVTVMNYGNVSETNFNVTAYANTTQIGKIQILSLGLGENTTVVFHWSTAGLLPCNKYTISANATIVPRDINATNNELTDGTVKIVMLGDVNADGIIDLFDIVQVAAAYHATSTSSSWNPYADIWLDGIIDVFDIVMIGQHFGEKCH
jgi:hypothetical protein